MIVDFVSARGGGFLMLGGRNSFSPGQLSEHADRRHPSRRIAGRIARSRHRPGETGADRLRQNARPDAAFGDAATNNKIWGQLPPLEDFNRVGDVKPGGVVLAGENPENEQRQSHPARFSALRTRTHDGVHDRQQLALADGDGSRRPDPRAVLETDASAGWSARRRLAVTVTTDKDTLSSGEAVNITRDVADKAFKRLNNARVTAKLTGPDGTTKHSVGLERDAGRHAIRRR